MTRDPKRIFIGLCLRTGDTRWETSQALSKLIVSAPQGYSLVITSGGGCDVAHARNLLLHEWRTRTDCGRLVFIDSDVVPTPEDFWTLIGWDVPYVGGLYPLKGFDCRWSWNGWARRSEKMPGLWSVEELCTGFVAMRFDLLTALVAAYSHLSYTIEDKAFRGEQGLELCQMGPSQGRRLSEDFCLSQRIRAVGAEVNVDPKLLVGHIGSVDLLKMHWQLGSFKSPELRG
jgi:hypothetical protein